MQATNVCTFSVSTKVVWATVATLNVYQWPCAYTEVVVCHLNSFPFIQLDAYQCTIALWGTLFK